MTGAVLTVGLLTTGENLHAIARWELSYELSPPRRRARYLAIFSTGASAQLVVGPLLVTAVLLPGGPLGWLALATLFVAATSVVTLAARPAGCVSRSTAPAVHPGHPAASPPRPLLVG